MSAKGNIRIKKDEENPESPEVLASSLIKIASGLEKILGEKEGLNEEAVVALLHNISGNNVSKPDIRTVIANIKRLKSYYVRKAPTK